MTRQVTDRWIVDRRDCPMGEFDYRAGKAALSRCVHRGQPTSPTPVNPRQQPVYSDTLLSQWPMTDQVTGSACTAYIYNVC